MGFQKFCVKTMKVISFDWEGGCNLKILASEGQIINEIYHKGVMEMPPQRIRNVRPVMCEFGAWFLLEDNFPLEQLDDRKDVFLAKE